MKALNAGMKDKDPLVRIGAVRSLDAIDLKQRDELGAHVLNDSIRAVRTETGRYLASVPQDRLNPGQQATLNQTIDEYIQAQLVNAGRGQLPHSEAADQTALRLDAAFYPALVNLADLYRAQKRDKEGEPLLRQALKVAPNEASGHHALGLLLV